MRLRLHRPRLMLYNNNTYNNNPEPWVPGAPARPGQGEGEGEVEVEVEEGCCSLKPLHPHRRMSTWLRSWPTC